MLTLVGLIFLILFFISLRISKSLFAPDVLNAGIWLFVILLYYLLPHNFYPIQNRFPFAILIWGICFNISSAIVMHYTTASCRILQGYNKTIYRIEIVLAILGTLVIAIDCLRLALTSDYFFLYLRSLSTGLDENIQSDLNPIWAYLRTAMVIVYLVELSKGKRANLKLVCIFLLLNLLTCFVTMAKSQLFLIVMSSIVVLKRKRLITLKQIAVCVLIFFTLSILIQFARDSSNDDFSIQKFVATYILSGSIAFEYFNPSEITQSGSNVFRFFEAIFSRLGLITDSANETILDYTSVGPTTTTNVYTLLYPYYVDYGYIGIAIFAIINGIINGFLYKKSKYSDAALIMYSLTSSTIIFGFFGELLFTNLSTYIQSAIYIYILYYWKLKFCCRK